VDGTSSEFKWVARCCGARRLAAGGIAIQGLIDIPFEDDIAKDAGVTLAKTMAAKSYQIDIKKL
jgi:hypothetical protein